MRLTRREVARTWLGVALGLVALVGCVQPPAEEESGEVAQATVGEDLLLASTKITLPPPGIGPADLADPESDGAQYLRQYCTSCHALPGPGSFSATGWPVYLRRMWRRMDALDAKYNVAVPTSAERVVLTRYLIDNALEVTRAELPPGQGRDLYSRECSRCQRPDAAALADAVRGAGNHSLSRASIAGRFVAVRWSIT